MRSLLDQRKAWVMAALLAAVMGALAWPWAGAMFARRSLEVSFTVTGPGPVRLQWSSAERANGMWIDLEDPKFPRPRDAAGRRTVNLYQNLPSYRVDRLDLRAEKGEVKVSAAMLRSRVFGFRVPSRELNASGSDGVVEFGALPPIANATWWPGAAELGAAAVGLVGVAWVVVGLVRRYDGWLERMAALPTMSGVGSRRRRMAALLVPTIGIPVFLALWAPMFLLADSTAYVWFAHLLLKTDSMMHFDGWRLPGYAMMIAGAMARTTDYAVTIGVVQAAMAIATPLVVFDMLRRRVGGRWATVAAIAIAVDPVLMGWQRVLMPETLSGLLIVLAAWLFLRVVDRVGERLGVWRAVGVGLILGLVFGAACVVRGNNQVVPAVLIASIVWCGVVRRQWSLLAAAVPVAVGTFVVMLPLFMINQQNHGRFTFAVGRDFTRSLFSWENGTTDWNQSGTLSFTEFRALRDKLRAEVLTDWDVMEWLAKTKTVPVPQGAGRWLSQEVRSGALVDEALARNGPEFTLRQLQAMTILLGVPITEPYYGVRGTWAVFTQLRGRDNHRTWTNFDFPITRFPPDMQETLQRSIHDVGWLYRDPVARVYGAWFNLWRWLRAVLAVAFLFALARVIVRREWAVAALGLVVLGNIVGVPVLTYAAEYRYAAPYYPLMMLVIVYGLGSRLRGGQGSGSGSPTVSSEPMIATPPSGGLKGTR